MLIVLHIEGGNKHEKNYCIACCWILLAGAAATSVSAQEYKVQEGDTLSGLSQEFDVSVDDLKAWNDLDSNLIVVNQLLDIQNEDTADNAVNQDAAPTEEQSDEEETDQDAEQPEETPADDRAAEQEDPNAEAPQQETNGEDEAVEQEPADEEDKQEAPEDQEVPDDQAVEQDEADHPEENEQKATSDDEEQDGDNESDGKTMTMNSTAYTAECDGCSGTTADGTELSGDENVIAVDPDEIPIGSEVHVEGYGDAVAADTGGDINGDRVDLHMGDEDEANEWGRQDVEVTVK